MQKIHKKLIVSSPVHESETVNLQSDDGLKSPSTVDEMNNTINALETIVLD